MKNEKRVSFTPHAKEKLRRLLQSGVTEKEVIKTVENPESLTSGYFSRKIAQSKLTHELVLRVVYEEMDNKVLVVTIYPAKKRRYE